MSILNEDSGSLIIAEGKHEIEMNSSDEPSSKEEDLFQLSRDDPTLSFHVEEQKKQQMFIEILEPSQSSPTSSAIQNQEQGDHKKKRKEIFQKFKRPQASIVGKLDSINTEDHLLNIFDSIFKTKVSQPDQDSQRQSKIDNNLLRPQTEMAVRSKTPSSEKRERLKIFGKKTSSNQYQQILPNELVESRISVPPAEPAIIGSPITNKKTQDSINFSMIGNRLSGILVDQNMDFSREEQDIKCILQSEIFRDNQQKETQERLKAIQASSKVLTSSDKIQVQRELAIQHERQPPHKKQAMLSVMLPIVAPQRSQPNVVQLEESRVLRSETSIISNSPLLIEAYDSAGGFRPQNSMANINPPSIGDVTIKGNDNSIDNQHKKMPALFANRLYQSQIIESKLPPCRISNVFQSERRIPLFLRQIRRHISIYPNFYSQSHSATIECIRQEFKILFDLFTTAIKILSDLCQTVLDLKSKKNLYLGELAKSLTEEFFLESGWEKFLKMEEFEVIKPMEPFQSREWSYQKAKTALRNYQNIVEYYKAKGILLEIEQEKGKRKYFEIRQKFWDICANMKLISQDIYNEMLDCYFPHHFHLFLQFLRADFPKRMNNQAVESLRSLNLLYKILKNENDLLVNSEIGSKIKAKMDLMTKYLIVY